MQPWFVRDIWRYTNAFWLTDWLTSDGCSRCPGSTNFTGGRPYLCHVAIPTHFWISHPGSPPIVHAAETTPSCLCAQWFGPCYTDEGLVAGLDVMTMVMRGSTPVNRDGLRIDDYIPQAHGGLCWINSFKNSSSIEQINKRLQNRGKHLYDYSSWS